MPVTRRPLLHRLATLRHRHHPRGQAQIMLVLEEERQRREQQPGLGVLQLLQTTFGGSSYEAGSERHVRRRGELASERIHCRLRLLGAARVSGGADHQRYG